jgi:hypothetical protein
MTDNILPTPPLPPVTIHPIKGGFRLACPVLGVTCTAPSLEAGYAALQELAAETQQGDELMSDTTSRDDQLDGTGQRATRTFISSRAIGPEKGGGYSALFRIVVAAMLLPLVVMALAILNDVRETIGNLRQFSTSMADLADDTPRMARSGTLALMHLADTVDKLTPERQEQLRNDLERISVKLAPVAQGLRPLFEAMGLAAIEQVNGPASGKPKPQPQP